MLKQSLTVMLSPNTPPNRVDQIHLDELHSGGVELTFGNSAEPSGYCVVIPPERRKEVAEFLMQGQ